MTALRVAVLGVGLIGGSIGLAARRRAGARVAGYDPDAEALQAALAAGAIDEACPSVADAVRDADVIFAGAPVGALVELIREALDHARPDCVLSDVGSTKLAVTNEIEDPRFIGGHPLAGAEAAGVGHAREDMFQDASWYLTSGAPDSSEQHARLRSLIEQFGAHPVDIDPDLHDRLMARVSHLPHVFANVLLDTAISSLQTLESQSIAAALGAGPSFRDATRVAGANTTIWTDIYMSNADQLLEAIDEAIERLATVRGALARGDATALAAWNDSAQAGREQLSQPHPAGSNRAPKG